MMLVKIDELYVVALLSGPAPALVADVAYADSSDARNEVIVSLPSHIAQLLRERNRGGRGGCPESNIFVHGFRYLGGGPDDGTMWFLGAPDYLCETTSFISVIATPGGEWQLGQASEEDWQGGRMLAGAPLLFQHSNQLGYFLVSEWQVEGPINFMYHSADGETWTSVSLPAAIRKDPDDDCCDAATISGLCVADSGEVFVSYEESAQYYGNVWSSHVDKSFPEKASWNQVPMLPDFAQCDRIWPSDFIPRSLREKTSDGAVFEVTFDRAVRIPGPTK